MYKIEKNIPIPENHANAKYPFAQMAVGDSVFLLGMVSTSVSSRLTYARKKGFRFTTRNEGDGVRVWRTA